MQPRIGESLEVIRVTDSSDWRQRRGRAGTCGAKVSIGKLVIIFEWCLKERINGLLKASLISWAYVVWRRWWTNYSGMIRMQQFHLLLPLGWRWTAGRLFKCTRASYNDWLIWLLCNRWRRCLDWINARVSTMFDVQRVTTKRWWRCWWWLFDKCCINLFVLWRRERADKRIK